jgi:fatty acid desaturase
MGLRRQKPLSPSQKPIVSSPKPLGLSDPYQLKGLGATPFTKRDIKWTPLTAILAAIFVGCPYVVAIVWTASSGLNLLAVILVVAVIVIAILFFLIFYLSRL